MNLGGQFDKNINAYSLSLCFINYVNLAL